MYLTQSAIPFSDYSIHTQQVCTRLNEIHIRHPTQTYTALRDMPIKLKLKLELPSSWQPSEAVAVKSVYSSAATIKYHCTYHVAYAHFVVKKLSSCAAWRGKLKCNAATTVISVPQIKLQPRQVTATLAVTVTVTVTLAVTVIVTTTTTTTSWHSIFNAISIEI